MASRKRKTDTSKPVPKVRLAKPSERPYQLRYTDPDTRKEVRISCGTHDESEAESAKVRLEAKLLLGIDAKPRKKETGPQMPWELFRAEYTRLKVALLTGRKSAVVTEAHLDVAERILSPKTLADVADPTALANLQAELLAGAESKQDKPRSPHTVKSYMISVKAAINWAHEKGWLHEPAKCKSLRTPKPAKGRPITQAEFDLMLAAVDEVCKVGPEHWKFFLRGLWESGLRLGEAYGLSWDDPDAIRPIRDREGTIVLQIPGTSQKNGETQIIPTIPAFGELLNTVPHEARSGFIFSPPKQRGSGRFTDLDQMGRLITKVGKEAGVLVNGKGKPASAHDLRRSFGQRMADAGASPLDLQAIMRHGDFRTTQEYYLKADAMQQAKRLAKLGTMYPGTPEETNAKRTHVEST